MRSCGIQLRVITQRVPKILFCIMSSKVILLKLVPHLSISEHNITHAEGTKITDLHFNLSNTSVSLSEPFCYVVCLISGVCLHDRGLWIRISRCLMCSICFLLPVANLDHDLTTRGIATRCTVHLHNSYPMYNFIASDIKKLLMTTKCNWWYTRYHGISNVESALRECNLVK